MGSHSQMQSLAQVLGRWDKAKHPWDIFLYPRNSNDNPKYKKLSQRYPQLSWYIFSYPGISYLRLSLAYSHFTVMALPLCCLIGSIWCLRALNSCFKVCLSKAVCRHFFSSVPPPPPLSQFVPPFLFQFWFIAFLRLPFKFMFQHLLLLQRVLPFAKDPSSPLEAFLNILCSVEENLIRKVDGSGTDWRLLI